jgi:hypothetical protein
MNVHLLNPVFNLALIGTFDALLAAQDGLPAWSPNGVGVFLREPHTDRLRGLIVPSKYSIVVPDVTSVELIPTYRLAAALNYRTRFLPFDIPAKDYTDYRTGGGTAEEFMGDVLGIESPFLSDTRADIVRDILLAMASGERDMAYAYLGWLHDMPLNPLVISHTMQVFLYRAAIYHPAPDFYNCFTGEEWSYINRDLEECLTYEHLKRVIDQWSRYAHRKAGGF